MKDACKGNAPLGKRGKTMGDGGERRKEWLYRTTILATISLHEFLV